MRPYYSKSFDIRHMCRTGSHVCTWTCGGLLSDVQEVEDCKWLKEDGKSESSAEHMILRSSEVTMRCLITFWITCLTGVNSLMGGSAFCLELVQTDVFRSQAA
jgi:hypothetical protein